MTGDLLHRPSEIIAHMLEDQALVTWPEDDLDWPMFPSLMPDQPDEALAIYDVDGLVHGRLHSTGVTAVHYGINLRSRSLDITASWLKMKAIRQYFDNDVLNETVHVGDTGYTVYSVHRRSEIISNGKEPKSNRFIHTLNAVASIRMLGATGTGT